MRPDVGTFPLLSFVSSYCASFYRTFYFTILFPLRVQVLVFTFADHETRTKQHDAARHLV